VNGQLFGVDEETVANQVKEFTDRLTDSDRNLRRGDAVTFESSSADRPQNVYHSGP
jgi:hypothetical protein